MPENNSEYQIEYIGEDRKVACISLGSDVLGGNDAMNFSSKLHELYDTPAKCLIVDLRNVRLINSSGLGMLVSGLSTLRKQNMAFMLADVPDKVLNLLKMTHLDKVFQIYPNAEEAIKNCK
ncbi:MAG: STAS domain-containing protein [Candidatus Kapaibacterium sp.]